MKGLWLRYQAMSDEAVNRLSLAIMVILTLTWVLPEAWDIVAPYIQSAVAPLPPAGPWA